MPKKGRKGRNKNRQVKRAHLTREIKYGELTAKKCAKSWRDMLMKIALPRLRADLEFAWHNFERVVDSKDFTISLLLDEIKNAEEQYMHNFRNHLEHTDRLLEILHDRLEELKYDFATSVQGTEESGLGELENIKNETGEQFTYLKTMLYKLEAEKREQERLKKGEYYARLDEVDMKDQLLLQKLRAVLEPRYQRMFNNLSDILKDYAKYNREKRKQYNKLKDSDNSIQELIAQQFKRMQKLQYTLHNLRQKYQNMKQVEGHRKQDLQVERQFFVNSFRSLKRKLDDDTKGDFNQMALVSKESEKTFDYLNTLTKKGETILKLAGVCRKFETLKEKIFPFHKSDAQLDGKVKIEDEVEIKTAIQKEMNGFWQKVGAAYGVHYTLQREKQFLNEENELVVDIHNEYCESLFCPEVKSYENKIGVNIIDGNMAMRKYGDVMKQQKKKEWY